MAERLQPSPELRRLLTEISELEIDASSIDKIEPRPKDGDPRPNIQVCRLNWPRQEDDAIVREATKKAVDESVNSFFSCQPTLLTDKESKDQTLSSKG